MLWLVSTNVELCIKTNHVHLGLVHPGDVDPEVLWFVLMQFYKPKPCFYILFSPKKSNLTVLNS